MKEYHQALIAADRATAIKAQLIPLLRSSQWSDTPFKFSDRTIKYRSIEQPEALTQKYIIATLRRKYPELADEIMQTLLSSRGRKINETLVATRNRKYIPE